MIDDFDPDPWGYWQTAAMVRNDNPGKLLNLYSSVLHALKAGDDVPSEIVRLLLEQMGPPTPNKKQKERLEVLRRIEVLQAFSNVPETGMGVVGGIIEPGDFRPAAFKVHKEICGRNISELSDYEKTVRSKEPQDFYEQIIKSVKGKRIIK